MIARFQLLLAFELAVAPDLSLDPFEADRDAFRIRVHPPYKSQVDPRALSPNWLEPASNIPAKLDPDTTIAPTDAITIDGSPAVLANTLQVDFIGSFDRTVGSEDPPTATAFAVVNETIAGLRLLARAGYVLLLADGNTIWRMTYLDDDETPAPMEEGKYRRRVASGLRAKFAAISPVIWDQIQELEHPLDPAPWDDLLIDAFELYEQIGPALVLAAAAVETRLETALNLLAERSDANVELWQWINDRGDYRKEPSVGERADKLMHALIGKSLKDEPKLWEAFQNLRDARNSFVHEGRAVLGKGRVPVTSNATLQLLGLADQIVMWIEAQLQPERRRITLTSEPKVQITQTLIAPR